MITEGPIGRLLYSLRTKRRPRSLVGLLRMWWHDFVIHPLFCGTEICEDCGRQYVIWHAPEELWSEVLPTWGASGLLCPDCFERRADEIGIVVAFDARALRRMAA